MRRFRVMRGPVPRFMYPSILPLSVLGLAGGSSGWGGGRGWHAVG